MNARLIKILRDCAECYLARRAVIARDPQEAAEADRLRARADELYAARADAWEKESLTPNPKPQA